MDLLLVRRALLTAVAASAVLSINSTNIRAAVIQTSALITTGGINVGLPLACDQAQSTDLLATSVCNQTGSFRFPAPNDATVVDGSAASAALAAPGRLGALATAILSDANLDQIGVGALILAKASATVQDGLTVAGSGPGFALVETGLSGSLINTSDGPNFAVAGFSYTGLLMSQNGSQECAIAVLGPQGQSSCSLIVPITFGQTFTLFENILVQAQAEIFSNFSTHLLATADFSHTVSVTGIEIFDANLNPIADPVVQSSSGFSYPIINPEAVPEPATLAFFGSGLLGLSIMRRRIRKCPRTEAKRGLLRHPPAI